MRFTRVTKPIWFSFYACCSIFVLMLAVPTLANAINSPHASPHGSSSYSETQNGGHGTQHIGMSAHGDKHHSKGHPGMKNSHHGTTSGHSGHYKKGHSMHDGGGHAGTGHSSHSSTHPGVHRGAVEFINHILKFKEGMSIAASQEKQLRTLKTQYKKDRITMKANVELANIDLHELLRNDQAPLSAIETHLKKVHELKANLYMASIKAKREAKTVLSPEQQARMDKIHERIKAHGGNMTHAGKYSRGGKEKSSY